MKVFSTVHNNIRDREYGMAWEHFSEDFKNVKYVKAGLSNFIGDMEGTLPANFLWTRSHFLELEPGDILMGEGRLIMKATYRSQVWDIEFVRSRGQWKIDWVKGYTPGVLLSRLR